MEKTKEICKRLLFLHPLLVLLLSATAALLLTLAFTLPFPAPLAYFSYAYSAYALATVSVKVPAIVKGIKRFKRENRYAAYYFSHPRLRVTVSLYRSFIWNLLYAALQLYLGVVNHSPWFYSLAAYYIILSFVRFFLARGIGEEREAAKKRVKKVGILLLPLHITLSGMSFLIAFEGQGFRYHEIATIALAAYTFTSFTMAVISLVRYRKYKNPIYTATKELRLGAAFFSMLSLETAMLAAFGGEDIYTLFTALTGAAVSLFMLFIAIHMIFGERLRIHNGRKQEGQ